MHKYFHYITSLFPSFIFCLRVLPFRQAIKCPILIHKANLLSCKGRFLITSPNIKFGMIKMGFNLVPLYKDTGIMIQNDGIVKFEGKYTIGSGSSISVSHKGMLSFGKRFGASAEFHLACYNEVVFRDNVLIGYECLMMDNDMHSLKYVNGGGKNKAYGPILINNDTWIGARVTILKNTVTPTKCVIAAGTIVSGDITSLGENCVVSSTGKVRVIKNGVYRDSFDDSIDN